MGLTVLSVGFCLNEVGPGSVGGAEQILAQIDEGLQRRGHTSLVVAPPQSRVAGTLIPTLSVNEAVSYHTWVTVHDAVRQAIAYALARYPVDIVHMHGQYFANCLPPGDVPTLVTFHLPLTWYKQEALRVTRPNTFFHCVSRSQRESFPASIPFLPDIENGIAPELLEESSHIRKRNYVALLGRICIEKGFHLALRAAKRARMPAFLAGRVYPFEEHQHYFAEQIRPELDSARRYIGPAGPRKKRRLLAGARCTVVPSLVPETSSLVAREAIASGTPVVAFKKGALPEVVQPGKTGFLIDDEHDLPDAIRACASLDPQNCRQAAQHLFTSDRMVDRYIASYHQILEGSCRKLPMAS